MNAQADISPPTHQIPLAVPISVCSILLLGLIAFAVYSRTYEIAIKELKEHEVVDLADEARKNADGLKATLNRLREDVLTLSQHPMVQQVADSDVATNQPLRSKLGRLFEDICRAHDPSAVPPNVPNWKHYMQVRLIDTAGHERVRLQRSDPATNGTSRWLEHVDPAVLDAEAQKGNASEYYKGDRQYFSNTRSCSKGCVTRISR
ncbi:MAG TPA: hypothetical protein EYG03_09590 [Planctomycetes bacterium]|nr:hypothetical protein [Fuerstiella sp.]HIK92216.1 hypothetical protein [Planctomycetota bacterium]